MWSGHVLVAMVLAYLIPALKHINSPQTPWFKTYLNHIVFFLLQVVLLSDHLSSTQTLSQQYM